jgi:hypothetical protein
MKASNGKMLHQTIRYLAFGFGTLVFIGGVAAVGAGGDAAFSGVWAIGIGAAIMIASVLQRQRYRSEAAERSHEAPGPGGGEDGFIDSRFLPTTERFIDPVSLHVMRVFVDPRTGERRYRAES